MIRYTNKFEEIIPLWQEAFSDTEEEILYFLENAKHAECLGYYENGLLVSLLFLVNCALKSKNAGYIYAACTLKAFKSRGYMTELLEYCKNRNDCLCLIPASDSLIDYYDKRGFTGRADIPALSFDECDEINEYLLEGYHLTNPQVMIYERS